MQPLAHITFKDTITLGSIIFGILIGLPGLVGLLFGAKWKAAATVSEETSRVNAEARDAYKMRAEQLGAEKDKLQGEVGQLKGKVEELEKRPQYGDVLKLIEHIDSAASDRTREAMRELISLEEKAEARTAGAFASHEKRAQERHEMQLAVVQEILGRIERLTT